MPKLRVHNFSISLDGYAAGPHQDLEHPIGVGGSHLHEWVFRTDTGRRLIGEAVNETTDGIDDRFMRDGIDGIGATIMGRNMFGPVRGGWPDEEWTGWWGDEPPYHHPVFVLTHHDRPSFDMAGGTTFSFVTDGIDAALDRAFDAADGLDVRLGGGASAVQQYLRAGLVDELHLVIVPVLLGGGERLFTDGVVAADGYSCLEMVGSDDVTHVRLARNDG